MSPGERTTKEASVRFSLKMKSANYKGDGLSEDRTHYKNYSRYRRFDINPIFSGELKFPYYFDSDVGYSFKFRMTYCYITVHEQIGSSTPLKLEHQFKVMDDNKNRKETKTQNRLILVIDYKNAINLNVKLTVDRNFQGDFTPSYKVLIKADFVCTGTHSHNRFSNGPHKRNITLVEKNHE